MLGIQYLNKVTKNDLRQLSVQQIEDICGKSLRKCDKCSWTKHIRCDTPWGLASEGKACQEKFKIGKRFKKKETQERKG